MVKVKVSNLVHHPLNKRVYTLTDIDDLISSISEVGLLQPLVIDQKNRVISGNRRLVAIKNRKATSSSQQTKNQISTGIIE